MDTSVLQQWQFQEILTTMRDYQTLMTQIAVVVITSSGILAFKNRRLQSRTIAMSLSAVALVLAVVSVLAGFYFRSRLIDVIPGLNFKENPTSLTDSTLVSIAWTEVCALCLAAILLTIAAAKTPRDRVTNGQ